MPESEESVVTFGISRHEGSLVESLGTEKKIEKAVLKDGQGEDMIIHDYNPTTGFNLKTRGHESDLEVGVGDPGITGFGAEGVTIIESIKYDEVNTDFPSAEASGTNHPKGRSLNSEDGGTGGGQ